MNNKEIANQFSLLSKLMDIHGENSFRSQSYSVAAYKIGQLTVEAQTLSEDEILKLNGIGDAIGKKIIEILSTGKMKILEDLLLKTPEGILEMLKIKGIGPKKISLIWKEMGIENIGELLYACNENRLLLYKGFEKKTQDNVIESIEFYLSQQGSFLFAQVENLASDLKIFFQKLFSSDKIIISGDFSRHTEIVDVLEYVIPFSEDSIKEKLSLLEDFKLLEKNNDFILYQYNNGIKTKLYPINTNELIKKVFETTGSPDFVSTFLNNYPNINFQIANDDEDIFKQADIKYIPPYLRENDRIISIAAKDNIPRLIQPGDIKGIIHCHSNWSDGINTLEQLAEACKESGKEYLVISDHSKAATYAQGLSEEKIRAQHELVEELNIKLSPFKIFKSIESDILNDGNLDYSDSVLSTFDLVIASVHSNLKMNEEKAMMRLLKAIENPYTTILGHMTGRLLLSRKGYPIDHMKIIDACASNNVVIEINAHPRRLDMRWQWVEYALSKNVLLSIDPDAHSIAEFENTKYGVLAAQKAMVTPKNNLSSFSLKEFEDFLTR
ncbi:MAG: helix-hairpin-helix domain-containing protein [Bacteroidota bacterium]|nr:helix-hairpin-helix domain-containing protein [Bacteroidota bacterium]